MVIFSSGFLWNFFKSDFCVLGLGRHVDLRFFGYSFRSLSNLGRVVRNSFSDFCNRFQLHFLMRNSYVFGDNDLKKLGYGIKKQKELILLQKKTNKKLQNEIAIRTAAEAELAKSLNEKETLFREIQHRMKNNIGLILGMINLEQEKTKSESAKKAIESAMNRIRAMGIVQDYLFLKNSYKFIYAKDYINSLVHHLLLSYGPNDGSIQLDCNVEEIFLPIEKAIPCGLIINEIFSNSFKHAFPENREGKITILFRKSDSGYLILEVGDNGVGNKSETKESPNNDSLGMNLIEALCFQLRGELEIKRENGLIVRVRFFL